jgi:flagellar M-ring protein FliF
VRASVTLDYDATAADETDETYDPDQAATLSMQRSEQAAGPQPVAAGVPGTASNVPNAQALPVYPRETTPPQSAKSESSTYGVSKSVRHTSEAPGRIRRLTAAIVVNDRLMQARSKNKPALWQPRSTDELHNLNALAQAAVGFDPQRGDLLTVEDLAFDDNRAPEPVPPMMRALKQAESSPVLVKSVVLLLGILVLLALGVRPAMQKAGVKAAKPGKSAKPAAPAELAADAAQKAVTVPPEPPPLDAERLRAQEILEQVTGAVKKQPAQSSRLLQSWIHSD